MVNFLPRPQEHPHVIKLHNRLREEFWLNEDLILRIKGEADVHIELIDGESLGVTETVSEVINKIATYRAYVLKLAAIGDFPSHPELVGKEA